MLLRYFYILSVYNNLNKIAHFSLSTIYKTLKLSYLPWPARHGLTLCRQNCSPRIYKPRCAHPGGMRQPETAKGPACRSWALSSLPVRRWPDVRPRSTNRCWAGGFLSPCSPARRRSNSKIQPSRAAPSRNLVPVNAHRNRGRLPMSPPRLHLRIKRNVQRWKIRINLPADCGKTAPNRIHQPDTRQFNCHVNPVPPRFLHISLMVPACANKKLGAHSFTGFSIFTGLYFTEIYNKWFLMLVLKKFID